jgi:molecular chaperone DnaJ
VNRYGHGDLLVHLGVYVPEKLTKEEQKLIEKLHDSPNVKPTDSASRSFFQHFKRMFD